MKFLRLVWKKFPHLVWGTAADHIGALQSALRKASSENLLLLREAKLARAGEREALRDFQLLAESINPKVRRP